MNLSIKKVAGVLLVVAALANGTLFGASGVWAKEKGTTLAKQIQGSWALVSIYNEQDGKKTEVFGPNPRGFMVFTPGGHYSSVIMRASLPKFASNNRKIGTVEENRAVVQGSFANFGTYKVVSEKEKTIILHAEGCTFPNWDDTNQSRVMTVKGDELRITNPNPTMGGGTNYIVFKRVK
jgi:hypothetical protein